MEEKDLTLNSFITPMYGKPKYIPSDEAFNAVKISVEFVKYYLATYYDMNKLGLCDEKVKQQILNNIESSVYGIIDGNSDAEKRYK